MANELIEIVSSLNLVMREETERLRNRERVLDLASLASAKTRLVGALEEAIVRQARRTPDWFAKADEETRETLRELFAELVSVSEENAAVLGRQIELSKDMVSAITAEARRLSGNRARTYGANGDLAQQDLATPISLDGAY